MEVSQNPDDYISSFIQESVNGSSTTGAAQNLINLQEQKRIIECSKRISKLVYGKNGLITFLHHMFGLLNEK